jgi:hypothetical protein
MIRIQSNWQKEFIRVSLKQYNYIHITVRMKEIKSTIKKKQKTLAPAFNSTTWEVEASLG